MEAEKARQMKELPEEHQRLTKLLAETLEAHDSARLGIDASHICSTLETNLSQHHRSLILASDEIARVTESVKDIRLSVCTAKASGVSQ